MKKSLFILFYFVFSSLVFAQDDTPPNPGGVGGDGFGKPASPIDNDLWVLLAVALVFLIVFAVRYRKLSHSN